LNVVAGFLQPKCYRIDATATNSCGQSATASGTYQQANYFCTGGYPTFNDVHRALAWESDLGLEGRLQLVVNGAEVSYLERGRAYGMGVISEGANHVEATLVEGGGKAGQWTFNFLAAQAIAPGSIRVIAGDALTVSETSITFRLKGTPGERIAFTFDKR
jgi:hypothetical protein